MKEMSEAALNIGGRTQGQTVLPPSPPTMLQINTFRRIETRIRTAEIPTTISGRTFTPLVSSSKKRSSPALDAGIGASFFFLLLINDYPEESRNQGPWELKSFAQEKSASLTSHRKSGWSPFIVGHRAVRPSR